LLKQKRNRSKNATEERTSEEVEEREDDFEEVRPKSKRNRAAKDDTPAAVLLNPDQSLIGD
jgi:cohesin complex subunit SA-1/2